MKKMVIVMFILIVFSVPAYAQMGMMGGQQSQMSHGMMQCCQPMMGQGMIGAMGMDRKGYRQWFQYSVTLMLKNADKLKLSDEQIKKLFDIKRKYSKDIIKQNAEMKIAEIDLEALLKELDINLSEVKEALKKVEDIKTQVRYLRIMAFDEARKVLTDEQKRPLRN